MKHFTRISILAAAVCLLLPFRFAGAEQKAPPPWHASKSCLNCHAEFKDMKDILAGNFSSRSNKAKSIQMKINKKMELVKFTPETAVKNVPNIKALKGMIPIRVHYKIVGPDKVATQIVAKPKMKVPEDQLVAVEDLAKLVAMGPEKGSYTLVDTRPGIKYEAGYIPTAISIPFPKMKKMMDKLPKDRNRKVIFYCEGFR